MKRTNDVYCERIYGGIEMDDYEHIAQEMVAFIERADQTVPHDAQTSRD